MTLEAQHQTARALLHDRRKALRFPRDLRATCQAGGGKTGISWPAVVRTISRMGAGLVLPRPFAAGIQFTVGFRRGDDTLRIAMMRVMWCQPESDRHYHGCAFIPPLTDEMVEALNQVKPPPPVGYQIHGIPCIVERIDNGKVVAYSAWPNHAMARELPTVVVMGCASAKDALDSLERQLVRMGTIK